MRMGSYKTRKVVHATTQSKLFMHKGLQSLMLLLLMQMLGLNDRGHLHTTTSLMISMLNHACVSLVGEHHFHGLPCKCPINHFESFKDLESTIQCNGISGYYYFCKLFPYSFVGDATHWFKKLPLRSFTAWNDIKNIFFNNFLYDVVANLKIKMKSMLRYMSEGDEQHGSWELSWVDEAGISVWSHCWST